MAKKDFSGGLGSLLKKTTENEAAANQSEASNEPAAPEHTERRATFIVREDYLDKINGIAFWERTLLKDQVNAALGAYIEQYEKANGEIKIAPKKAGK